MSRESVEIVVHIDETLDDNKLSRLEESLCQDFGIECVRIHPRRQHLMLVDYLPDNIDTMQVLNYVTSKGLHAELVGGI